MDDPRAVTAQVEAIRALSVAAQKAELIKWMFGFWAPTAVGVIALLLK